MRFVTPCFGVNHEHDGVETVHRFHEDFCQLVLGFGPDVNYTVIAFFIRNQAAAILVRNYTYFLIGFAHNGCFFFRYYNVRYGNTYTSTCRIREAKLFDSIQNHRRFGRMISLEAACNDGPQIFLTNSPCNSRIIDTFCEIRTLLMYEVAIRCTIEQVITGSFVNVREAGWEDFIENNFPDRSYKQRFLLFRCKSVFIQSLSRNNYTCMQRCCSTLVGGYGFVHASQNHA
ncbi:hypothetical protein D3C85_1083180 [compost metagenome]